MDGHEKKKEYVLLVIPIILQNICDINVLKIHMIIEKRFTKIRKERCVPKSCLFVVFLHSIYWMAFGIQYFNVPFFVFSDEFASGSTKNCLCFCKADDDSDFFQQFILQLFYDGGWWWRRHRMINGSERVPQSSLLFCCASEMNLHCQAKALWQKRRETLFKISISKYVLSSTVFRL